MYKEKTAEQIWKKDNNITLELIKDNYFVLRFWENDILKNIEEIGNQIHRLIR